MPCAADGRRLKSIFCGYRPEHDDGAGRHRPRWWIKCIALKSAGRSMTNFRDKRCCVPDCDSRHLLGQQAPVSPLSRAAADAAGIFTPIPGADAGLRPYLRQNWLLANPTGCCGCSARRPLPSPYPFMTTSPYQTPLDVAPLRASSPRRWWRCAASVWLARLFTLPDEIQRSPAVRSVTTPFALAAAKTARWPASRIWWRCLWW